MREILERCIELDNKAGEIYRALAQVTENDALATVFDSMAREESMHVTWWIKLLEAWETGLVPDIADQHEILGRVTEILGDVDAVSLEELHGMSTDDMLDLATKFEFLMLDPVLGELMDLMQPGSRRQLREAYSRHVLRLVEAIEQNYTRPGLAAFLAGVLKRAYRDQQKLVTLAVRDQLTGLYNRRGLLGHLSQWLSWSNRYQHPIGIALVDVDYFKHINDQLGHLAGDEALRRIAHVLLGAVRSSDMVGRFGGDEFVILAPEADGQELTRLMERLVTAVSNEPLKVDGEPVILSVTVGGAWVTGGTSVSPEALIATADRSLYAAKGAGRNRAGDALVAVVS